MMRQVSDLAAAHERALCLALNEAEHQQLADLLGRIADQQGLPPASNPGYRQLDRPAPKCPLKPDKTADVPAPPSPILLKWWPFPPE